MRPLILFLLTVSPFISWQQAATQNQINSDNIPDEVRSCLKTNLELEIDSKMNPFLISGDFDGDGFTDFAVQVKTRKDQRKGILVCFAKRAAVVVGAGASTPWSQKPDDRWPFDSWFLVPKGSKQLSIYPKIKFDALALLIGDEGGGLMYWDGRSLHWQQEE